MSNCEIKLKIVLVGDNNVGKSWLLRRYDSGRNPRNGPMIGATIGASFLKKHVQVCGKSIDLEIWDTAGHQSYDALTRMFYRNAAAAVVAFTVTDAESVQRAKYFVRDIREYTPECRIYLCSTKNDLTGLKGWRREVSAEEVSDLAAMAGLGPAFETSAVTGESIFTMFQHVAADCINNAVRGSQLWSDLQKCDISISRSTGIGR